MRRAIGILCAVVTAGAATIVSGQAAGVWVVVAWVVCGLLTTAAVRARTLAEVRTEVEKVQRERGER